MSLKGKAAIVGYGETIFQKKSNKNLFQLASEAAKKAVEHANLSFSDIDGIITLSPLSLNARLNLPLAEFLGMRPTYSDEVSVLGASGGYALKKAAEAITAKTARNVLVVGADLNTLYHKANDLRPFQEDYDTLYGSSPNNAYALAANLHSHLYGTTTEQRAKVAIDQRYNASFNENSLYGKKGLLTVDDIVNSPVVSSPLHLFEIVSPCNGAIAFVVSPAEDAKQICTTPVIIDGAGFSNGHYTLSQSELFTNGLVTPIKKASETAFQMAGITTEDIDVLGLYDCYTIAVILSLEDMGFCRKGEGGRFVQEHDLTFKGDLPVNTSGGQLSVGQPGDAGGMVNVVEVVRQLMGQAGERQIKDCEIGVANTNGGYFSTECTLVLRRAE